MGVAQDDGRTSASIRGVTVVDPATKAQDDGFGKVMDVLVAMDPATKAQDDAGGEMCRMTVL